MPELETVKIKHKNGFCIINKSDFDKEKHVLLNSTPDRDGDGYPSTVELLDAIEKHTGDRPHHRVKRETLIAKYNSINSDS